MDIRQQVIPNTGRCHQKMLIESFDLSSFKLVAAGNQIIFYFKSGPRCTWRHPENIWQNLIISRRLHLINRAPQDFFKFTVFGQTINFVVNLWVASETGLGITYIHQSWRKVAKCKILHTENTLKSALTLRNPHHWPLHLPQCFHRSSDTWCSPTILLVSLSGLLSFLLSASTASHTF